MPVVNQRIGGDTPLGATLVYGGATFRTWDQYLFWIRGSGTSGFKRDPYAHELGTDPSFPDCPCLVRASGSYPWHDSGLHPPAFSDLVLYQLHVGTYWSVDLAGHDRRPTQYATFVDLVDRIPYLRELGVNAVQLLPIQEFSTQSSLGYNGVDYFSPEMEYQVYDAGELAHAGG